MSSRNCLQRCEDCNAPDIYHDNSEIVHVFSRIDSQWRHGMNGVTGLDYTAVSHFLSGIDIEQTPSLWEGLQVLEFNTLAILSKDN